MDNGKLFDMLAAYGADMSGINDRFMGDTRLYAECFEGLLSDQNIVLLSGAMSEHSYADAFQAAHALKGVTGNLGLTPLYDAICVLVESLRAERYERADAEYEDVKRALAKVASIASGECPGNGPAAKAAPVETQTPKPHDAEPKSAPAPEERKRGGGRRFIAIIGLTLLCAVVTVSLLFVGMIDSYLGQIDRESATHLEEINYQIKLYIEERIESDWQTTHSMANGIAQRSNADDLEKLVAYLREECKIWDVSNMALYTRDGQSVDSWGGASTVDAATELAYQATRYGEYMSIVESQVTFTVPVETSLTLNGSPIVALSVVQDESTFLDKMDFSSFDGAAYIYLVQQNGVVISGMTHPDAPSAFNVLSLLAGKTLYCLTEGDWHDAADILESDKPITYLLEDERGERYVVSTPIGARLGEMRLIYVVPEGAVNETMNQFTNRVTHLSVFVITAFAALSLTLFLAAYRSRKRLFDKALLARERMFNLLVRNTGTAFALLEANRATPVYSSTNAEAIVGSQCLTLDYDGESYRMRNGGEAPTPAVRMVNEELLGWDGLGSFTSGYLPRGAAEEDAYFLLQLYPTGGSEGEFVAIGQDATKAYARERVVMEALEMSKRSNEAKSHFLSNMSHDIRTPMNAIINMTEFAIESIGDARRQREYLETIRTSSRHLLRLVNDVLDMSRIESGQISVGAETFDIKAEIDKICGIVRPLCGAKSQTFIEEISGVHAGAVIGDQLKFSQILMNLLSNAVKYTPDLGAIRFSARELDSPRPEIVALRFSVEDNGIGIRKENLARVFEPFMRGDRDRISGVEGTGLGLSICKSYVEAMGGSIKCESEIDSGSVFTVELSFQRANHVAGAQTRPPSAREKPYIGKCCLLCEDVEVNRMIARKLLERAGFMVETAADGQEALHMFEKSKPGHYDILYMDIQMPLLDGYQVTVAIRESAHPQAKTVPIVAMTANVFVEDVEKARIAGMNGHLGKPLIVLDLIEETNRVLRLDG